MQHISAIEISAETENSPSPRCQHGQSPESCTDCAVLEVRETLRQLRPILQAALRNPIARRWLGLS